MPDIPQNEAARYMLACEAFIRRASQLGLPFMLKGSYLTRQYFPDPTDRIPEDVDWLCLARFDSGGAARALFSHWVTQATELPADDGVTFTSFRQNDFWRRIDYAMSEDFPTVNTDLDYCLGEHCDDFVRLDISFNLPMDLPSEPLLYRPLQGEPFVVPHAAPLALQVAWKLHQSLVRPRLKDLIDLLHLVRHAAFTPAVRKHTLAALRQECAADGTDVGRLRYLLAGNLEPLLLLARLAYYGEQWAWWRDAGRMSGSFGCPLPTTQADLEQQLRTAFALAGFEAAQLPEPVAARPPAPGPDSQLDSREELLDLLGG